MKTEWRQGNRVRLLQNGDQFFPRVFAAIEEAEREVLLETFILFEDKVGLQLRRSLMASARRGVRVEVTVDGFGSPNLSREFVSGLTEAGVRLRVFGPGRRLFGLRTNPLRRMHRKLVCIDQRLAYVGGINYSADHLLDFGPEAKQDYTVELEGPVVADIHQFLEAVLDPRNGFRFWRQRLADYPAATGPRPLAQADAGPDETPSTEAAQSQADGGVTAATENASVRFVVRDNRHHRTDIERQYRHAIRSAREHLLVANAYFFPGFRLLRDMRLAAQRGVEVHLVLQGRPDEPIAMHAARLLYRHLAGAGVRIHEYGRRPLHGKVAVADREWATVGSSNLDPISLALNLEANVFIRDPHFSTELGAHLDELVARDCKDIDAGEFGEATMWQAMRSALMFHFLRRFPRWSGLLPAHVPEVAVLKHGQDEDTGGDHGPGRR